MAQPNGDQTTNTDATASAGSFDDLPSQRLDDDGADGGANDSAGDVLDSAFDEGEGVLDEGADEFHAAMNALENEGEDAGEGEEVETSGEPQEEDASTETPAEETGDAGEEDPEQPEEEDAGEEEPEFDPVREQRERLSEAGIELGEDEDLVEYVVEEREANAQLIDAIQNDPDLQEALRLSLQEDMNLSQAVSAMELEAAGEDDPDVIRSQAREEARREQRAEEIEAARERGQQMRDDFQEAQEYSDEEMGEFLGEVSAYVNGDPANGGALPSDFLQVMHRGLRYEQDVEAAREEGETEGRNQQIRDRREKKQRGGDGLPKGSDGTTGGETEIDPDGPTALARELSGGSGVLDQLD